MAKKKSTVDTEWKSLADELQNLIPQLDSEGLAFLLEQARIHLYNMKVVELNRAADAANAAALRADGVTKKAGKSKVQGQSKNGEDNFTIHGTESGSSYYLRYGNNDLMFSRDEMIHLVKIVNADGTNLEIGERLYNWFNRERKDFFAFVPITNKHDSKLTTLVNTIKKNLKLRQ